MRIEFILNGKPVSMDTNPDRRVVDLLREDLGLTGTKEGCGSGECGACTIMVQGVPRLSCLMLAPQLDGCNIKTIEGIGENELHAVQKAFVEHGAVQCGFCTPGMVLSSISLLEKNPAPSRQEIRNSISGNICRCTGYHKIVDAIESVYVEDSPEDCSDTE